MKKYLVTLIVFTAGISFIGCKKDAAASKNYTTSIADKTWWGTLTNAGEMAQPYSVHFNADKTLKWSQYSGNYDGTWSIDNNRITLNFQNPAVQVSAEISEDNTFKNIIINTANKVNSAQLVDNPNIPLDNTVWNGTVTIPTNRIDFTFLAGAKVEVRFDNVAYIPVSYTRLASGGAVWFPGPLGGTIFCVITSGTQMRMKGDSHSPELYWKAIKQ
jgi:hypothetical protein